MQRFTLAEPLADLPDPHDALVSATHKTFVFAQPQLAACIREMVQRGDGRDQIMLHLRLPFVEPWLWDAANAEIDYQVALLRSMSTDIVGG